MRRLLFVLASMVAACRTQVQPKPLLLLQDQYWCVPVQTGDDDQARFWAGCGDSVTACEWLRGQIVESGGLAGVEAVGDCTLL